jgi:hypothetical protein
MMAIQKVFLCLCALLPMRKLQDAHRNIITKSDSTELKDKNKQLKENLKFIVENLKIDLKLNTKQ